MACVFACGCSLVFSKGPENPSLVEATQCSTTLAPPIVDTLIAGGLLSVATVGVVESASRPSPQAWEGVSEAGAGLLVIAGAIAVLSAVHGYNSSARCRGVKRAAEVPTLRVPLAPASMAP